MTTYTVTLTGEELGQILYALRYEAANYRSLVPSHRDVSEPERKFQQLAEQLDELATRINLRAEQVS